TVTCGPKVTTGLTGMFIGPTAIESVWVLNPTPPELKSWTFANYNATLYIPVGSDDSYWLHPVWSRFSERIESSVGDILCDGENAKLVWTVENNCLSFPLLEASASVEIYTLSGMRIYCGSPRMIPLSDGIYIVRYGQKTAKLKI
ncbi:MAG: hypothetical protein K2L84_02010, partial [Muribaculaceae bacterium]|nr:hypothetical protein [Muribaculaceae bacterium]